MMTELVTKPVPPANKAKAGPPAVTLDGLSEVIEGAGADTGNPTIADWPPPGSGLNTKTRAVPLLSISLPKMLAVNCVELTKAVARAWLPKYTAEPGTKFDPFTVKTKGAAVATAEEGEREEIMGMGFGAAGGPLEITTWAPLLCSVSVNTGESNGVRIPEEELIEKPRIWAKAVYVPAVYCVAAV